MNDTEIRNHSEASAATGGTVTIEPMHNLERYWQGLSGSALKWDCLFMLPPWLGAWWSHFGRGPGTLVHVVRHNDSVLGLAPLVLLGETARLVGDSELIDYSDLVVAPSREMEFFSVLFDDLRNKGMRRFALGRVRSDSTALSFLRAYSADLGCRVVCDSVDVFYEMELPDTWEGYLDLLSGKERHEIRRKLRRLESAGRIGLRTVVDKEDVPEAMDTFISLFRSNREEKARFMTGDVESFFRSLAGRMAGAGLLRLFFLDLDDRPVATAMCFEHLSTFYLYNNGYDRSFDRLSVGLLCKAFSIKESIRLRGKRYNFLRGSETYKGRLGGRPVSLLHCEVALE